MVACPRFGEQRNAQHSTLNNQQSTLNTQHSTFNAQRSNAGSAMPKIKAHATATRIRPGEPTLTCVTSGHEQSRACSIAHVAELADAYGSGPYGATRGGSSPLVSRTRFAVANRESPINKPQTPENYQASTASNRIA